MKGARPIPDKTSYNFITKNINGKSIYEKNLVKDFCNSYSDWIQSSKLNNLQNLNKFKSLQFVHGTKECSFITLLCHRLKIIQNAILNYFRFLLPKSPN